MPNIRLCLSIAAALTQMQFSQISIPNRDDANVRQMNGKQFPVEFGQKQIDEVASASKSNPNSDLVIRSNSKMRHRKGEENTSDYLSGLTANSDLVIEGVPKRRTSMICEDGTFVCSDYEVLVTRVYSNRGVAVLAGQTIVIARPGGDMQYKGRSIRGVVAGYKLFHLNERYILYLRLIRDSGAFLPYRGGGFLLDKGDVIPDEQTSRLPAMSSKDFLDIVEKSSSVSSME